MPEVVRERFLRVDVMPAENVLSWTGGNFEIFFKAIHPLVAEEFFTKRDYDGSVHTLFCHAASMELLSRFRSLSSSSLAPGKDSIVRRRRDLVETQIVETLSGHLRINSNNMIFTFSKLRRTSERQRALPNT